MHIAYNLCIYCFFYAVNYCRHINRTMANDDGFIYIVEITNHVLINGLLGVESISQGEKLSIQVQLHIKAVRFQ